ncbi:hypothetical protein [Streptomyces sp. NPDC093589]|uniref:hypothetical protein n=1 Tax=Streptomyces sp. NPDC093589 TaxID=3366043 RepID=UPI00382DB67C
MVNLDLPQDLLDAQRELHQVQAELHALYGRLPWSAVPLPGYGEREDSPGYTDEEKVQVAALRARQLDLTVTVSCHGYWASCPGDVVKARSALKHAHEPAEDSEEVKA